MHDLTNTIDTDLDQFIDKFNEIPKKRALALSQLLDEQLKSGRILATRSHMGTTDSYVSSQTLDWLGDKLSLFVMLPLMNNHYDPETGKLTIDHESVQFLQQRKPNWSRQAMLTRYLLLNSKRKFPPLLVVVSEPWVDNPNAPQWKDGRATTSSIPVIPIDPSGRVVFLDFTGDVMLFTVDGQHRLLGIQGLRELLRNGFLQLRRADGGSIPNNTVNLAEESAKLGIPQSNMQTIKHETMGVEFIPAVMLGETRDEAHQRIRSIFVSVNKTAAPVSAGELATLDEDDGFAIIARKVALAHPLFTRDEAGDRVNWKSSALPAGGKWLTTVAALRDMAERYLGVAEPYSNWKVKSKEVAIRPDADALDQGEADFTAFLDQIGNLPSFGAILRGASVDEWREFPTAKHPGYRGHVLFRPLGQLILAQAVADLHRSESGPLLSLDKIFTKLKKYDSAHGFENVASPASLWYGITFDPTKHKMLMTGRDTAIQLLKYLVNGADADDQAALEEELRDVRKIKDGTWYDLNGDIVKDPEDIRLPAMI